MMFWIISVVAMMFLWAGIIYFISATRYIHFQKARHIRFDQEAADWKEREEDRADALLESMGMSAVKPEPITGLFGVDFEGVTEVEFPEGTKGAKWGNKPLMEQFYAAPKNGRSLFDISGTYFSEAGINESPDEHEKESDIHQEKHEPLSLFDDFDIHRNVAAMPLLDPGMPSVNWESEETLEGVHLKKDETYDFEESGGRRQGEQWVNFVRTYWSERLEERTIVDDKMVYTSQSEATESALRTADHLGLTGLEPKIINDYAIDEDIHRVTVEWITEKV